MIVAYPNFKPSNMEMTVLMWQEMMEDYSYAQAMISLKTYIATDKSGFAPSIGAIIQGIPKQEAENLNEMQAWALVSKALRNGYYGAEKEFEALPEIVQKAVGNPSNLRNWSQTDVDSVENVIQSNFMRTYRTLLKREEEKAKIPASLRIATEKILKIGDGEHGNVRERDLLELQDR